MTNSGRILSVVQKVRETVGGRIEAIQPRLCADPQIGLSVAIDDGDRPSREAGLVARLILIMHKLARLRAIPVQSALARADPKGAVRVCEKRGDPRIGQRAWIGRIRLKDSEIVAIVSVQATGCAKPAEAGLVLCHGGHHALRKPLLN